MAMQLLLAAAMAASISTPAPDDGMPRSIAAAAATAERSAPAETDVRLAVANAGENVLVTSGATPEVAQRSLERVLGVCGTSQAAALKFSCPATPAAYDGLRDLLVKIRRLAAQQIAPGAGQTGISAFGAAPASIPGGGGPDYN
uniref:UrcA family protein n=1 Tax=Caulobacter sp. (strain K31) TaxID=366602 RepID=B0T454_CAUSK